MTRRTLISLALLLGALALVRLAGDPQRAAASTFPKPLIEQRGEFDCGPAALAMMVRSLGLSCDPDEVAAEIPLDSGGASLLDLVDAASRRGVRLRGYRLSPGDLKKVPVPAIALVKPGHYLVIDAVTDATVEVRDPAWGTYETLTRAEFESRWEGIVLLHR